MSKIWEYEVGEYDWFVVSAELDDDKEVSFSISVGEECGKAEPVNNIPKNKAIELANYILDNCK